MATKSVDSEKDILEAIADIREGFSGFERLSANVALWQSDVHYRDLWDNLLISIRMLEKLATVAQHKPDLLKKYFNNMSTELDRVADYCSNSGESDTAEIIASMQRASKRLEKLIS
ncbi:MAG: hypothetical protein M1564_01555 [Candidatus Marsarchaeota archaeon]|jgi:hypothetical protein|nr:hypothetical protein [Candidatus Marsarchaeota archaeon]MCL5430965.1 hypothetical protein [Candidatus Marsarchaeota archaeon]